jgi:hypothetical protein
MVRKESVHNKYERREGEGMSVREVQRLLTTHREEENR